MVVEKLLNSETRSTKQPLYIVLRKPPESLTQSHFASFLKQAQEKPKESRLAQGLSDLFFSFTPVILGGFVVEASAAAIPLTGSYHRYKHAQLMKSPNISYKKILKG